MECQTHLQNLRMTISHIEILLELRVAIDVRTASFETVFSLATETVRQNLCEKRPLKRGKQQFHVAP